MARYKVTNHSSERIQERVGIARNVHAPNIRRAHTENWVNQVMPQAKFLRADEDGKKEYVYDMYRIVIAPDGRNVVTVLYNTTHIPHNTDNDIETKWASEIKEVVRKKIYGVLKSYQRKERELLIEKYEAEIRRLRVHNPKTQEIIQHRINEVSRDVNDIRNDIKDLQKEAKKYGVEV